MEEPLTLKLRIGAPVPGAIFPTSAEDERLEVPVIKSTPVEPAQESILSKIFKAKSCIYCRKPVSFFSSKHDRCGASASRVAEIISERIARYLEHGDASYIGKKSINALAAQRRLSRTEIKSAVQQGFECAVRNILSRRVLSREDELRFSQLADDWGFQESELNRKGSWNKIVQSFVIRDLLEGKVPDHCKIVNSPLLLGKNESYVWIFNGVDVYKRKIHRSYEGHHASLSLRIAKGVYLREGVYRGHPVEHVSTDHLGRGDLIVTNKNLFFVIQGQTKKLSLKKIVSANPHSDGITFRCGGSRAPQYSIRRLDAWFAYNVIVNLSALG